MTASTISSLIPSRSISTGLDPISSSSSGASASGDGDGDGGGVCSYLTLTGARWLWVDREGEFESSCDRFNFLAGGSSELAEGVGVEDRSVEGGESRAAAREACVTGRWMPSDGNESDLRRVLYGMVIRCVVKVEVVVMAMGCLFV